MLLVFFFIFNAQKSKCNRIVTYTLCLVDGVTSLDQTLWSVNEVTTTDSKGFLIQRVFLTGFTSVLCWVAIELQDNWEWRGKGQRKSDATSKVEKKRRR